MQQFFPCNSCGNQIPIPELHQGELEPEFLDCENCGEQVSCHFESIESPESETQQEFVLELELEPEEEPSVDWSVLGPVIPQRRQKEVSAIRKMIPSILGGLAAFPIATLIMWYGFGKDIGSTGPTVSQYVPWIVPQKFRTRPWESPRREFESSGPSQGNSSRPSSTTQSTLPTLNRENQVDAEAASTPEPSESAMPSKPAKPSKPAMSETIMQLRTLQQEWETTPKAGRTKMLQVYCITINQLSEQASHLKGRSAVVWRKDLEEIAREILTHPNIPRAIQLGAIGKLTGVPTASTNDFIATVMILGDGNDPKPNAPWSLQELWPSDKGDLPVEVSAGAWRAGTTNQPANCLIFGQLVTSESPESELVFRAHLILPQ